MDLFLIRHGQSSNNALTDIRLRNCDPLLTPLGEQQADRVAAHLAAGGHLLPVERCAGAPFVDRLYCSPMVRALQTAAPIGRALGLRPHVWIETHEFGGIYLDHGDARGVVGYPGQTRAQMAERFPECCLPEGVREGGWWSGTMEEYAAGHVRAGQVARTLREWAVAGASGAPQRLALVSHGGFLAALLQAVAQQPCEALYYEHANTGITRLTLRPEGTVLLAYANRLEHLPEDLVTWDRPLA